jgi:hypothetical protein
MRAEKNPSVFVSGGKRVKNRLLLKKGFSVPSGGRSTKHAG